jgi:hypothetical protein
MYEFVSDPGLVPEGVEDSVDEPKSSSDPSNIDLLDLRVTVILSLGVEMLDSPLFRPPFLAELRVMRRFPRSSNLII